MLCAVVSSAKSLPKNLHRSILKRRHNMSTHVSIRRRHRPLPSLFISNYPTTTTGNTALRKIHRKSVKNIIATTIRNMGSTTNIPKYCDDDDDELVIQNTQTWIQNVVIDLNFCPFAEKSRSRSEIFTSVVRGDDVEEIVGAILDQCLSRKESGFGTSLIVCPDFSRGDFCGEYMEVLGIAEDNLGVYGLEGHVQIAPFHPLFEFSGSGIGGVDNLTNRSPYPTFHILREEEVSTAVRKIGGDSSKIWQRNVSLLQTFEEELGREKTEMIMRGEKVECMSEILSKIKGQ